MRRLRLLAEDLERTVSSSSVAAHSSASEVSVPRASAASGGGFSGVRGVSARGWRRRLRRRVPLNLEGDAAADNFRWRCWAVFVAVPSSDGHAASGEAAGGPARIGWTWTRG
jgi:hypothetical protein